MVLLPVAGYQLPVLSAHRQSHSYFILQLETHHLNGKVPSYGFLIVCFKQVALTQAPCVSQLKISFVSRTKWLNRFGSNFSRQNFQVIATERATDASPHYLMTGNLVESSILTHRRQTR